MLRDCFLHRANYLEQNSYLHQIHLRWAIFRAGLVLFKNIERTKQEFKLLLQETKVKINLIVSYWCCLYMVNLFWNLYKITEVIEIQKLFSVLFWGQPINLWQSILVSKWREPKGNPHLLFYLLQILNNLW